MVDLVGATVPDGKRPRRVAKGRGPHGLEVGMVVVSEGDARQVLAAQWADGQNALRKAMAEQLRRLRRKLAASDADALIRSCAAALCDDERVALLMDACGVAPTGGSVGEHEHTPARSISSGALRHQFLDCATVCRVLNTFQFEDDKLRAATILVPFVANPASRQIVLDCFCYDSDEEALAHTMAPTPPPDRAAMA